MLERVVERYADGIVTSVIPNFMKVNCQTSSDGTLSRLSEVCEMQAVSEVGGRWADKNSSSGRYELSIWITIVSVTRSKHIHSYFSAISRVLMSLQYSDNFLFLKLRTNKRERINTRPGPKMRRPQLFYTRMNCTETHLSRSITFSRAYHASA